METTNGGLDTVRASISYTLEANLEQLYLQGTTPIAGVGNSLGNVITGDNNSAANQLSGGIGNDTYILGPGDTVLENPDEGTDTIKGALSLTTPNNVDNLILTGSAAINGTGNALANSLTGNAGDNVLSGQAGNDTLIGNSGHDTLIGGTGNDTLQGGTDNDLYSIGIGDGQDVITDTDPTIGNADRIQYETGITPLDLVFAQLNNDLVISRHQSADQITITNWYSESANHIETIEAGNGQTLMDTQVAQLIQDMAAFCNQNALTWDQAIDTRPTDVATVLAGNWEPTPAP